MKYYGCIYKIQNIHSKKVYIGQTTKKDPYKRINKHFQKQHYIDLVYRTFLKNKQHDDFKIEIICSCFDQESLNHAEIYFISYFNSLAPNGYNLKAGGHQGGKASIELKERYSKIRKGKPATGRAAKGCKKSPEHVKAMSLSRKGFTSSNRLKARQINKYKVAVKIIATNMGTGIQLCFRSITDCADVLNLEPSNVSRTARGLQGRKQHKGWSFKIIE